MGLIVALRTLRRGDRLNSPNKRLAIAEEHHPSRIQAEKNLSEGQELHRTRGSPSRCLWLHYRRPDFLRGDWLRVCSHRGYFCPGDDVLRAQQENHKTSRSPSVSIWVVLGSVDKILFKKIFLNLHWKCIFISCIIYTWILGNPGVSAQHAAWKEAPEWDLRKPFCRRKHRHLRPLPQDRPIEGSTIVLAGNCTKESRKLLYKGAYCILNINKKIIGLKN